jgi:tetratricopeptide (TPR) repeat protein
MYDPSVSAADQNLLYGLLALQADLITRDQFVGACQEWAEGREISFPRLLVQRGWLKPEDRREVERLVERKIARHGGDVRACLAELANNPLQKAFVSLQDRHLALDLGVPPVQPSNGDVRHANWGDREHLAESGRDEAHDDGSEAASWQRSNGRRTLVRSAAMLVVAVLAAVAVGVLVLPLIQQVQGQNGGFFGGRAQPAPANPRNFQAVELHQMVRGLYIGLGLNKEAVFEYIRRDPSLTEDQRDQAMGIAEAIRQDPNLLNSASWYIVRQPAAKEADYEHALHLAETAIKLEPNNGYILNTLGVAQYRAGRFAEALKTLKSSDEINSREPRLDFRGERIGPPGPIPADLAFLAMASYRLGEKEEARAYLEQLRKAVAEETREPQAAEAFLREAEALIEGKPMSKPKERPSGKKTPKNVITA